MAILLETYYGKEVVKDIKDILSEYYFISVPEKTRVSGVYSYNPGVEVYYNEYKETVSIVYHSNEVGNKKWKDTEKNLKLISKILLEFGYSHSIFDESIDLS